MIVPPLARRARHSLLARVLVLTLATMMVTELLVFLPAISRERRVWIEARLVAGEMAALAVPLAPPQAGTPAAVADRTLRLDLLRLAGAVSVRLQEPGRPPVVLSQNGNMVQALVLLDIRRHRPVLDMLRSVQTLAGGDRTLLAFGPSPKRPGATVSVVLQEADLVEHLRGAAASVALQGLGVAAITGLLVHIALRLLLVVPMRRITGSIVAFRADPEHTPPLNPRSISRLKDDEMALAGEELAGMQHDLRAALWRNARMAALGAAVTRVSHDLRGVLSPAMLAAERLQANPDAKVSYAGDIVLTSLERALVLVRSTLAFAAEVPPAAKMQPEELRGVVQEAADQVQSLRPGVTIDNLVEADRAVSMDRSHMLRVLGNLMRNSIEAGASHLRIACTRTDRTALITVGDDGPGLPEVVQKALFRPFVTSGKPAGTGLGLAISRDLLRAMNGDLVMVRTGPTGVEFRISLAARPDPRDG
jgi:signal transduction histidine kinase